MCYFLLHRRAFKVPPLVLVQVQVLLASMLLLPIQSANAAEFFLKTNTKNTTIAVSAGDSLHFPLGAEESFLCSFVPTDPTIDSDFSVNTIVTYDEGAKTLSLGNNGVIAQGSLPPYYSEQLSHIAVLPKEGGRHTFSIVATTGALAETIEANCWSTTLYSGFNTNVNDFNFLEIENKTAATVLLLISMYNRDGSLAIPEFEAVITGFARIDVNVHQIVGDNTFGRIVVRHSAAYGAIGGRTAMYVGDVTNFTLGGIVPLRQWPSVP